MKNRLNILQVSTADRGGGAEKVAWDLFRSYSAYGHVSWLAVRTKKTDHPNVIPLASDASRSAWARFWLSFREKQQTAYWTDRLRLIAEPIRYLKIRQGVEDFEYPATWQLLDLIHEPVDVIHCHNLHADYFDPRTLSALSRRKPVILSVHDEWLLTGHCAFAIDCDRWKIGCGICPDLQIYPPIARDATAYNWRRKKNVFVNSRVYISAPCHWLLDEIQQSLVAKGIVKSRVIPYGVDLSDFHPSDRRAVRARLGIPDEANVLLFVANGIKRNKFKDYETIRAALARLSERIPSQAVMLITLGEDMQAEQIGSITTRFVPYETDVRVVASYFQAADLYLHAAKADTFPNVILESLACGTPVIATAVGGIPEQIKGLRNSDITMSMRRSFGADEATGVLVNRGNAEAMACAIEQLLKNESLRCRLAENAANDARQRFDLTREVMEYLDWYRELVDEHAAI